MMEDEDLVDEGCEVDIKSLQRNIDELSIRITPRNDRGEISPCNTDLSSSPRSDTSETLGEGACGGGRRSPGALQFTSRPPRLGRSPRRRVEDEQYVYSLSQSSIGRLGTRRRSDPGRISVSPLRSRVRVDCDISEDGDYTEDSKSRFFQFNKLAVAGEEAEDGLGQGRAGWRPRSRSPNLVAGRVKTLRSQSLPGADPAIMEIGEAIGAIALQKPEVIKTELSPEEVLRGSIGGALAPRRRRSVSVECSSPLEAIVEDSVENDRQKTSRRYSTPAINIT